LQRKNDKQKTVPVLADYLSSGNFFKFDMHLSFATCDAYK